MKEIKLIKRLNSNKENNSAVITRDSQNNLAIEISKDTLGEISENIPEKKPFKIEQGDHEIFQDLLEGAPSVEEVRDQIATLLKLNQ